MSLLPTLEAKLSVKATKQEKEKLDTANNNNNNNNNSSQAKNTTHSPVIQHKNNNNNNINRNNVKNFCENEKTEKVKNLREASVQNETENPTPTQQQQQIVNKISKNIREKKIFENMKSSNELKATATMAASATCDSSNNNNNDKKVSVDALGNNNTCSSGSASGNSHNRNNSNHKSNNDNNEENNRNSNSISLITSNGVQIKIEECDESVQIKTEDTETVTEGSVSGESSSHAVCAPSGVATTTQLTTAIDVDNNNQNRKQQKPRHDNDNKRKQSSSCSSSSSISNNNSNNVIIERQHPQQHQHDEQEQNDPNDLIFARPKPVPLTAVNPHIICNLCYGYLIDATTIVECLHSFCHSCLIKHLRTEQYCPRCEMMINTAKPNIKPDTTLQAIVYKLVPGLYEKELLRRRAFYKNHPEEAALATPEQRGDDTEHLIFSPSEYMSLSLEYADIDEHIGANAEYSELSRPRYIQCPAKFTVAHMKKFVHSKFSIDCRRFSIDIMYKVKTIVLLDHYTVMDIAYIYTWKRDAPMRFFFRVKECLKPLIKQEKLNKNASQAANTNYDNRMMTVIHTPIATPVSSSPPSSTTKLLPLTEIKVEEEVESVSIPATVKHFEIVSPRSNGDKKSNGGSDADNLKITIVSKPIKDAKLGASSSNSEPESSHKTPKQHKEKRVSFGPTTEESPKEERKVENIKLKIDLSKQKSVTIINMSDPERKEIVKPVSRNFEKEWKVKNKKEKEHDNGNKSPSSNKTSTTLTVPPLTLNRTATKSSPKSSSSTAEKSTLEEDPKSQFLKSFALAPISSVKNGDSPKKQTSPLAAQSTPFLKPQQSPPKSKSNNNFVFKEPAKPLSVPLLPKVLPLVQASKRKSKEPIKTLAKKPKLLSLVAPAMKDFKNTDDFKIKLPTKDNSVSSTLTQKPTSATTASKPSADQLMPPPSSLPFMRPPINAPPKKSTKTNNTHSKIPTANGITPHPTLPGVQVAAPGNRTPIAKRYQPILPKTTRPNPFADLPSAVNQILKDNGTEIKSITNEKSNNNSKVYGATKSSITTTTPSNPAKVMGPPPLPKQKPQPAAKSTATSSSSTLPKPNSSSTNNSYLNYAIFNASKTKGNEVPPGCRTPMYSPNSPIYSPSSPQYAPNYTIPTVPQYKYTPKPNTSSESILQSILGGNNAMSELFPSPPVKKAGDLLNRYQAVTGNKLIAAPTKKPDSPQQQQTAQKRSYPFTRSPSPNEDPPEKQLKVKSLLNSCNINIPSSLSITITRDDGESTSNSVSHPKHKSPVNNYIEILKLPDPVCEINNSITNNQRQSPPANPLAGSKPTLPPNNINNTSVSNLSAALKNFRPHNHNNNTSNNGNRTTPPPQPLPNSKPSQMPQLPTLLPQTMQRKLSTSSPPPNLTISSYENTRQNQIKPPNLTTNQPNQNMSNQVEKTPTPKTSSSTIHWHPVANSKSPNQKIMQTPQNDKKTSSPEKRAAPASTALSLSPPTDNKQSKPSLNTNIDGTKKFRPILPRAQLSVGDVVSQKVTSAGIIGTYASPSGVSVNVHGNNRKVAPPKKSPNMPSPKTPTFNTQMQHQQQQKQPTELQQHQQQQFNAFKSGAPRTIASSRYSPTTNAGNKHNASPNSMQAVTKKTPPPTSSPKSSMNTSNKTLSTLTPPAQSPPVSQAQTQSTTQKVPSPAAAASLATTSSQNAAAAQLALMGAPNAQPDFTKLLKENLLRAQVHAAAAANPAANMLYTYANAAAAAQMYNATTAPLYSYQHAYIVEQISRLQRANNEALLSEYIQKLKAGMDNGTVNPVGQPTADPKSSTSSAAVAKDANKTPANKAK